AIAAFALSLLGTFLVRSGVLTSVHSFAADPSRGLFILVFLSVLVGGSLLLYALRARQLSVDADDPRRGFTAASRETLLLVVRSVHPLASRTHITLRELIDWPWV
ncbi:cytochrome c-type biogenesis CcmF C-terminal domain-containing protein, partial [Mesorhizobium sp. M1C.F.Ca.ET.176.01.1.1]|uniref:cytochrome c-type biogenesis CcmF C-terminal domain-containing protein n=1 Tax=Mesorhizobium sp. M1C.F.Ca.ET.176.01.1.1 TaxID=2563922 RepID=UPI00247A032A